jgi:hypothetical protein
LVSCNESHFSSSSKDEVLKNRIQEEIKHTVQLQAKIAAIQEVLQKESNDKALAKNREKALEGENVTLKKQLEQLEKQNRARQLPI